MENNQAVFYCIVLKTENELFYRKSAHILQRQEGYSDVNRETRLKAKTGQHRS